MTSIKENDTLAPLLEFMFDFLQGSHGKMVDASKFDIRSFELDQSETYEKETQWLLVHLYFLCLRHVANMTKNWWIDTKKRIKGPVETWTEKHVSRNELTLLICKLICPTGFAFGYRRCTAGNHGLDGHAGPQ